MSKAANRLQRLIYRLPSRFREGKMPYAFLFAWLVIAILLVFAAISPYPNAPWMFLPMVALLLGLMVAVQLGLGLSWLALP